MFSILKFVCVCTSTCMCVSVYTCGFGGSSHVCAHVYVDMRMCTYMGCAHVSIHVEARRGWCVSYFITTYSFEGSFPPAMWACAQPGFSPGRGPGVTGVWGTPSLQACWCLSGNSPQNWEMPALNHRAISLTLLIKVLWACTQCA